jgi:outer membrane protein OmpA-like peptidoglycan-associated protein
MPFVPYGLVPLLGLLALMVVALVPFAFGEIQGAADAAARVALKRVGADWATSSVSGQWVTLGGKPPTREAAAQAIEAVKKARSGTLFGEAQPATWVIDHFTWTEDPLNGPVNRPRIGGQDDAGAALAPPPPTDEQLASCDTRMSVLLNRATIEFSTASTIVNETSGKLLDAIAQAAASCPGVLRVEGHTDNVGRAGFNVGLSRERAEAVRAALIARGVPADRLVAEGFGSRKPIADNHNGEGRARNRRIEIHAVRPSPT